MAKNNNFRRRVNIVLEILLKRYGGILSDRQYLKLLYFLRHYERLNLKNPKTFNDKLNWLKLYYRVPEYTELVDKNAVKLIVANKLGAEYIIPTLGIWNTVDDIEWDKLPNKFVLKTTHGGGGDGVVICRNKSTFDFSSAIIKLQKAMNTDPYKRLKEWPYKNVPHKIIAEQYIDGGEDLYDYKFFCFTGKVKFFKIDFNRFVDHHANYYDVQGKLLPFGENYCPPDSSKVIEMPKNLDKMIAMAEKLSEDLPFARIDFYNINGRILFGEITFFPAGGMKLYSPDEWNYKFGEWIQLPKNRIE